MSARFVLITDTHYHPSAPHDFGAPKLLTRAPEVLEATVPAVNAVRPEFVVHGGDLLCGGDSFAIPSDQYERSLLDVVEAYAGFDAPVHYVPGNHDCDADRLSFDAFARTFPVPAVLDVIDVAPRLRLALANVYHEGYSGGGQWTNALDESLRVADGIARSERVVLFLVLHPWIHPGLGDGPEEGVITGAARLRDTLAECPAVAATFSGHRHANRVRLCRDYVCVDTACMIGYPLGFRELTVDDSGWLTSRWHTLDLPDMLEESARLASPERVHRWAGEAGDRDTTVLLPRARQLWSEAAPPAAG